MKRDRVHHLINAIVAAPMVCWLGAGLVRDPSGFNPWDPYGQGFWVILLPALLVPSAILCNSIVALCHRDRSENSVPQT